MRTRAAVATTAILLALLAPRPAAAQDGSTSIRFEDGLDRAIKLAAKDGRPVMLYFMFKT